MRDWCLGWDDQLATSEYTNTLEIIPFYVVGLRTTMTSLGSDRLVTYRIYDLRKPRGLKWC